MAALPPGAEIAGFRIVGVAGRGGMGVVYRATQPGLGRVVALKVVADGLLDDPRARARFLRESRAAAAIEHPHVIPIHAAGEEEGTAYLAMRYVSGPDLLRLVGDVGPLAPARAVRLIADLASALDAAHASGLVHRDVKPANVLLDAGDHSYLCDFGLARTAVSSAGLTATGGWVGSVDYIAPEQLRDERVDLRADVYALGGLLHFALTGRVPFPRDGTEARMWAHLHAAPPRPSEHVRGVPRALDAVVARAMAKEPRDRFPTAGALGSAALDALAGRAPRWPRGRAATARAPDAETLADGPPAARRRATRSRRAPVVAALGAAILAGGAAFAATRGGEDPAAPPSPGTGRAPVAVAAAPGAPPATRTAKVGPRPVAVAVAGGSAWVASTASTRLARVEASTMRRRRGSLVGRGASDLVARDGVLWVAAALANAVVPLRADTGRPAEGPIRLAGQPRVIDSGEGAIWVGERFEPGPDRLVRVDPVTRAITARGSFPGRLDDLAAGLGAIWVLAEDEGRDRLSQVEPGSGRVLRQLEVGPDARQVDAGAGAVWVTNHGDDTVARVNPRTGEVVTIGVPSKPYGLSVRPDGVWVACYGDQSVVRIDPATRRVAGAPVFVGINPIGIDAGPRHVWVTAAADNAVTRVDAG